MTMQTSTDEEFIALWKKLGSVVLMTRQLGISKQSINGRRKRIEKRYNIKLEAFNSQRPEAIKSRHDGKVVIKLVNGVAIVFSDAHYYPGEPSTAHKALIRFIKQFHPEVVVCNGDALSGETISRWPRIGWDNKPTLKEEIEAVTDRLGEIEQASKGRLVWTLGNHDARYETCIAQNMPQLEGVRGSSLKDHFPRWLPAWACWINENVCIKHRFKGGIHAPWNNTINSGVTTITGHLHSQKVIPFTDYNGTRYGVDTGCLAATTHEQFVDYTEANPLNWRSGFAVLTFRNGELLPPELVSVWNEDEGTVTFRGDIIRV